MLRAAAIVCALGWTGSTSAGEPAAAYLMRPVKLIVAAAAGSTPDLLAGRIQIGADALPSLLPYIREGKVRALAVTSAARLPELPDVPTLAEIGIDGYPAPTWMGLVAPAGIPRATVDKPNAAVNEMLRSAALRERLAKLGFKAEPSSPDDFARLIATDAEKWAAVVALSGAKGD
jgi:tripartite-type tricarboxylate transporter receptor subunit TctC